MNRGERDEVRDDEIEGAVGGTHPIGAHDNRRSTLHGEPHTGADEQKPVQTRHEASYGEEPKL